MQGMRRIFALLGIPVHAEITAGLAWDAYAALNVYQSIHTPTMPTTVCQQSQYLAYAPGHYEARMIPRAGDWPLLKVWESTGQEDMQFDWRAEGIVQAANIENVLANIGVSRPADIPNRDGQQTRRMITMMRHLDPTYGLKEILRMREQQANGNRGPQANENGRGIQALRDGPLQKGKGKGTNLESIPELSGTSRGILALTDDPLRKGKGKGV